MKLTRYTSLVTLILAGAFSVSSLNARPDPVSDLKVKEDVGGVSALDRKEDFAGSKEKFEKPSKHEFKREYDIVLGKDVDGSLVGKNQRGDDIIRLDSKRGTFEMRDLESFGVVADVIAKQKGDDISISLSGAGERKDEKRLREIYFAYGLILDLDGNRVGKIQRGKFKKLAGELEAVDVVGKEAKSEEHSRLKINLTVLEPSLTATLNEYILSGQFKIDYGDKKYTYDIINPFFENYNEASLWFTKKPDGFYGWRDGIRIHKHGKHFSMIDPNKGIAVFGTREDAREFQEKLREKGIFPVETFMSFNNEDPFVRKFQNEDARLIATAGGTIVPVGPNSYDEAEQAVPRAVFLNFDFEDFHRVQDLYS